MIDSFDHVVIGVVTNPSKTPLLSAAERVEVLNDLIEGKAEVEAFDGLLVDFARSKSVDVVVKGLRALSDFDYELAMAQMNRTLSGVETLFIPTNPQWSYLSSSLVREVARLGGNVESLVPPAVQRILKERLEGPRDRPSRRKQREHLRDPRAAHRRGVRGEVSSLSGNVLIDRDQVLERLQKIQAELPNELRAARSMVREREAFIARTNERAKELTDKAQAESRRLISDNHVLAEAVEEANILVRRAEGALSPDASRGRGRDRQPPLSRRDPPDRSSWVVFITAVTSSIAPVPSRPRCLTTDERPSFSSVRLARSSWA